MADNSRSLFQQTQDRFGGSKSGGWQLYRMPQMSAAVVKWVVSDLERKRICSGGRDGHLRLSDAAINI